MHTVLSAGRARIVLGNRRWGGGGFMRNGRMYARPVNPGAGGSGASGRGSAGASTSTSAGPASAAQAVPAGGKGKAKAKQPVEAAPDAAAAAAAAAAAPAVSPADPKGKARAGGASPPALPPSGGARCSAKEKIPKSAQAQYAWDRDGPAAAALGASPLGRSPCSFGSGAAGSWMAAALGTSPGAACVGSAPGSGRRAKRNARRAAVDSGTALDF